MDARQDDELLKIYLDFHNMLKDFSRREGLTVDLDFAKLNIAHLTTLIDLLYGRKNSLIVAVQIANNLITVNHDDIGDSSLMQVVKKDGG